MSYQACNGHIGQLLEHPQEKRFHLAFGSEAIIPTEMGIASYKIAHHDEGRNKEGIHLHLDLLDEVREMAEQWMDSNHDLMAKHYNSKVNLDTLTMRTSS